MFSTAVEILMHTLYTSRIIWLILLALQSVVGIINQDLVADFLLLSNLLLYVSNFILKLSDLVLNRLIFVAF